MPIDSIYEADTYVIEKHVTHFTNKHPWEWLADDFRGTFFLLTVWNEKS